jgi:hypothetical protein
VPDSLHLVSNSSKLNEEQKEALYHSRCTIVKLGQSIPCKDPSIGKKVQSCGKCVVNFLATHSVAIREYIISEIIMGQDKNEKEEKEKGPTGMSASVLSPNSVCLCLLGSGLCVSPRVRLCVSHRFRFGCPPRFRFHGSVN